MENPSVKWRVCRQSLSSQPTMDRSRDLTVNPNVQILSHLLACVRMYSRQFFEKISAMVAQSWSTMRSNYACEKARMSLGLITVSHISSHPYMNVGNTC